MKIQIANVRDEILKENKIEPVAIKNGKLYRGHLFFEPVAEKVEKVLDEIEIPDYS